MVKLREERSMKRMKRNWKNVDVVSLLWSDARCCAELLGMEGPTH